MFSGCALGNVCTTRADGSGLSRLPVGEPWPRSSSFSPDAATFTFSSGTEYPGSRIEVIGVDGSGRRVVPAARGRNQDPAWQPLTR